MTKLSVRSFFLCLSAVCVGLFAHPAFARIPPCEYRLLLDTDNNAATGCSVHVDNAKTPDLVVDGIDQIIIAMVDRLTDPPSVLGITRRVCSGGTFGSELPVSLGPWNVGEDNGTRFDDTSFADVVEGFVSRADLGNPSRVRVGFVAECNAPDTDFLLTTNGQLAGPVILFDLFSVVPTPMLSAMGLGIAVLLLTAAAAWSIRRGRSPRRALLVAALVVAGIASVALARTIVMDGQVGDWSGIAPVATNGSGSSNSPSPIIAHAEDIVAGFLTFDATNLYFRIDLNDITLTPG